MNSNQVNGAQAMADIQPERVILVRQEPAGRHGSFQRLEEIQLLAKSAGAEVAGLVLSKRSSPDSATFIGSGKVAELRQMVQDFSASVVIVDHSISPVQERNLERAVSARVVDRTRLILDIFARRASSREGKLQVELAQLKHLSTRLIRGWTHLERQKGGIGLRGPGETQLETDRRLIGRRIKTLVKRLEKLRTQRELRRVSRKKVPISTVALVGYTNAGKSALFNRLTGAAVGSQDMLFSTLDTTMRRFEVPSYGAVIISDTVGFIRDLPHGLISAFHATLEEVSNASLLLHVIDSFCEEECEKRIDDVDRVLDELQAGEIPRVEIYNKIDLTSELPKQRTDKKTGVEKIWLSAKTGAGVEFLAQTLCDFFRHDYVKGRICIPPYAGKLRSSVYNRIGVASEETLETGESVLDLEMCDSDIQWLNANQDFRDEYWQIKPFIDTKA